MTTNDSLSGMSLIEKLEKLRSPVEGCEWNYPHNCAVDACIAIVRQHQAEQPQEVVNHVASKILDAHLEYLAVNNEKPHLDSWEKIIARAAIIAMGDDSTRKDEFHKANASGSFCGSSCPIGESNVCIRNGKWQNPI